MARRFRSLLLLTPAVWPELLRRRRLPSALRLVLGRWSAGPDVLPMRVQTARLRLALVQLARLRECSRRECGCRECRWCELCFASQELGFRRRRAAGLAFVAFADGVKSQRLCRRAVRPSVLPARFRGSWSVLRREVSLHQLFVLCLPLCLR